MWVFLSHGVLLARPNAWLTSMFHQFGYNKMHGIHNFTHSLAAPRRFSSIHVRLLSIRRQLLSVAHSRFASLYAPLNSSRCARKHAHTFVDLPQFGHFFFLRLANSTHIAHVWCFFTRTKDEKCIFWWFKCRLLFSLSPSLVPLFVPYLSRKLICYTKTSSRYWLFIFAICFMLVFVCVRQHFHRGLSMARNCTINELNGTSTPP